MKKNIIRIIAMALCLNLGFFYNPNIYATQATENVTTNELANNEVTNDVEAELRDLILNYNKTESIDETTAEDNTAIETYSTTTGNILSGNGVYRLAVGANSNKAIEVKGSNIADDAEVDIWDYGNATAQKFNIEYSEEGYYKKTYREEFNCKKWKAIRRSRNSTINI